MVEYDSHASYWVLILWSLGADEAIIRRAYEWCHGENVPAISPPEPITSANVWNHVTDDKFYTAYLDFFTTQIQTKGISQTLEEYIFAPTANFIENGERQPCMLQRLYAGVLHPLIHVGYGAEFGMPGLIVEGLALAAVERKVTPSSMFTPKIGEALTPSSIAQIHAFTILARILQDPRLDNLKRPPITAIFKSSVQGYADILGHYAAQWSLDTSTAEGIEGGLQELIWANTILYGVGGWKQGKEFNANLFTVHLVTSVGFLPAIVSYLSPSSIEKLLRGYFTVSLAWWIAFGRPSLDFEDFFASDFPKATPTSSEALHVNEGGDMGPWTTIIKAALRSEDYHIPKLQRILFKFSTLYGSRKAGLADFTDTQLPGIEYLDGTLFLRVAYLTANRVERERPGVDKPKTPWDIEGFWKE